MEYKTCTKCGESFPATSEFFHRQKTHKDWLQSHCKTCRSENARERRKNPEVLKKQKQQKCEWRKNNLEKDRKRNREYSREWRKDNLEKYAANSARRRTIKLNQTPEFTESEDKQIKLIYKKSHELGSGWQVDHIYPLIKGGLHHPNNLQIVTKSYNLQKGSKLNFRNPFEWEIYNYDMG